MRTARNLALFVLLGAATIHCGSDPSDDGAPGGAADTGGGGSSSGGANAGGNGGAGGEEIDPRFQELIDTVEAERQSLGAPGVAIAVIENGEVTFAKGFGSKDPEAEDPVLPTTLFRIGSVNKMLTTVALLREVADGDVEVEAPVTDYVPEFEFAADPSWAPSIRIEDALRHASGIYDYLEIEVPDSQKEDSALESYMTGGFGNMAFLMNPPGVFFNYSNPNYYLAGLVAEKVSGKPYRQLMKEDVFEPLGMTRTYFLGDEVIADGDYALGKADYPGIPDVVHPDTYDNAWARPAGYASSSVLDLAKFVGFLLDGNEAVLPKALSDEMQSPHINEEALLDLVHYGYGLQVWEGSFLGGIDSPAGFYDIGVVEHTGAIPGFSARVSYIPSLRFGVVILANVDDAYFSESLKTAYMTLADLPEPSAGPELAVHPEQFGQFVGTYHEDFGIGDITVTQDGDDLVVEIPDLADFGITYDPVLVPLAENSFYIVLQGGYYLPVTFINDGGDQAKYFRTRIFVGIRPEAPQPAAAAPPQARAPISAERKAAFAARLRAAAKEPMIGF
ncbi:MAG: serine hydrolase [Polyangiaceae bacterium]|nr:serine hydrolase [Polyangiaceae bacterium]